MIFEFIYKKLDYIVMYCGLYWINSYMKKISYVNIV